MRRAKMRHAGILAVAFAIAGFGAGALPARADVITLDVSASMVPVPLRGASCSAAGCMLGGNIVIDNSPGATNPIISAAVTMSGASPGVLVFNSFPSLSAAPAGLTDLTILDAANNSLDLIFATPTQASLVGYAGGPLDPRTTVASFALFAVWDLTSGSLTPQTPPAAVPEPSSLLLMLTALVGLGGLLRKRLSVKLRKGVDMTFAKRIAGAAALGFAMLIGCGLYAPPAQAAYIVTLMQEGPNVVATGSGTLDLAGLTLIAHGVGAVAVIFPFAGEILTGPATSGSVDFYSSIAGPTSFGNGGQKLANSGNGDFVDIDGSFSELGVPPGYVSGNPLSDNATYDNQTFASLGVTPGSYVWTWGSGPTADSFTLDIVAAAVPEPSNLALLVLPLGFVVLLAARHCQAPRGVRLTREEERT